MGWDKCHLWDLSSGGSRRTRFAKFVHIRIWKHKNNCKDLSTFKYISFLSVSLAEKHMFTRNRHFFRKKCCHDIKPCLLWSSPVSGEKTAWTIGVGSGYSWFCLSFFVLLLSCVTHPSWSLRAYLRLSEKRRKIAHVPRYLASSMKLRINDFLFLFFFTSQRMVTNKLIRL